MGIIGAEVWQLLSRLIDTPKDHELVAVETAAPEKKSDTAVPILEQTVPAVNNRTAESELNGKMSISFYVRSILSSTIKSPCFVEAVIPVIDVRVKK